MEQFISKLTSLALHNFDAKYGVLIFALLMIRMIVIINVVPFLGSKNAPATVKLGISAMFAAILFPAVSSSLSAPLPDTPLLFVLLMLKEVFVGFAIGFITAEIFYVVEIAGQLIDVARATNQIQLMVPEMGERTSAFGSLNFQLVIVLFLAANLHVYFFEALAHSFIAIPIDRWPQFSFGFFEFAKQLILLFSHIFAVGVALAAPVGIVCLLVDVGFGLLNRVAPQINAYFMSLPAKALGGTIVFLLAFSLAIEQYLHNSMTMFARLREVIRLFG